MFLDMLLGGLLGAALAGVILAAGLGAALFAKLFGAHVTLPNAADLRAIQYYVGGFAVAGAGLGAAKPLRRTRFGTYVAFATAGATVMIAIAVGQAANIASVPLSDVLAAAAIGALFGCAIARVDFTA